MHKEFMLSLLTATFFSANVSAQHEHIPAEMHNHMHQHDVKTDVANQTSKDTNLQLPILEINAPVSSLKWEINPKQQSNIATSDGADYLKNIPGFTATRRGGTMGDPMIRSMFGSRLNIQTNEGNIIGACGMRMDNPMSYVTTEAYDRIVIIKGPQSVIYGAATSAATIRFEKDMSHFSEPTLNGFFSNTAGTNNRSDQTLHILTGNRLGYVRLDANHTSSDDYKDGRGTTIHSQWDKWNDDIAIGFTPTQDLAIELAQGKSDGEAAYAASARDGTKFDRTTYSAKLEALNITNYLVKVNANYYYNFAEHLMDNYRLRPKTLPADKSEAAPTRKTVGSRLSTTWQFADNQLIAGFDYQKSSHYTRRDYSGNNYKDGFYSKNVNFINDGYFAEFTFGFSQSNRVITGLRWDKSQIDPSYGDSAKRTKTRKEDLISSFARFEQDIDNNSSWFVGVGHTERLGDFWELFSSSLKQKIGETDLQKHARTLATLKTEKTTQLDAGFSYVSENANAWITSYIGQVDDFLMISFVPAREVSNIKAQIAGFEAGGKLNVGAGFNISSNLAYSFGKNVTQKKPLPQISPFTITNGLGFKRGKLTTNTELVTTLRQNRIAKNQGNPIVQDIEPSSSFALVNLNATYKANNKLQFTTAIDNLFDRFYREYANMTGVYALDDVAFLPNERIASPGRSFWLKMNYSF